MKNEGFYIKSLVATGENVPQVKIDFVKGCNLIFGESDTGKSHVLHLIDYLLGKKDNPKKVVEGVDYNCFFLEISLYSDDSTYTIQRKLNGKSVLVKPVSFSEFSNPEIKSAEYSISVNGKNSYSDFLMGLSGFDSNVQIRQSQTSKKRLSFSYIRHLILADENRVISEDPIFNPTKEKTNSTSEKSLIYFLMSGVDDSEFTPEEKPDIKKARISGKLELLDSVIKEKEERIISIGDADYADFSDESFIKYYKSEFENTNKLLEGLYSKLKEIEETCGKLESKRLFAETFLKRIKLLNKHYALDIERYDFLYQGHQIFEVLSNNAICPLCKSKIEPNRFTEEGFADSIKAEYANIIQKKEDSDKIIKSKENELSDLNIKINQHNQEIELTKDEIKNIEIHLDGIRSTLERYQSNIESKTRLIDLQDETQSLRNEYKRLEDELKKVSKKESSYSRSSKIEEDFCNLLKDKLSFWGIKNSQTVVFDEKKFDFILGGKERLSCGKGTRGVTYTAIIMTLVEYCIQNNIPFTRTLVIDSPITAHFSDEAVLPEETTQNRFFQYCNDYKFEYQLIIIDNKSPKAEDREKLNNINYISFSETSGFYPVKNKIDED